jgi:thiol-disulfide isomerase/thioredoxin
MANTTTRKKSAAKPASKGAPQRSSAAGRPAGLFTWIAVGLVVLVIVVLVAVKVVSGSSTVKPTGSSVTSATLVSELTTIPTSTFNTVGITSPAVQIYAPVKTKNQPVLQWADAAGVKRPTVFYLGAEYCPYCAATRWATIIALSRFGTLTGLYNVYSSSIDVYKNTPTFTFVHAKFVSKWINFVPVESYTNIPLGNFYQPLQSPTKAELTLVQKYDTAKFIPGMSSTSAGSIPFISFGNQVLLSGSAYSPSALANTTRDAVAGVLSDPSNALTQAIVASANLQTASICKMIKNADTAVCSTSGVKAAYRALGL